MAEHQSVLSFHIEKEEDFSHFFHFSVDISYVIDRITGYK